MRIQNFDNYNYSIIWVKTEKKTSYCNSVENIAIVNMYSCSIILTISRIITLRSGMWYEIQQVSQGTEGLEGEEKKEERKLTSHKYIQYELKRKWLVGGSRGSLLLLALASGCLGGWSCASFYIINWFFDKKKSDVVQWARKWLLFIFGNMVYI